MKLWELRALKSLLILYRLVSLVVPVLSLDEMLAKVGPGSEKICVVIVCKHGVSALPVNGILCNRYVGVFNYEVVAGTHVELEWGLLGGSLPRQGSSPRLAHVVLWL